MNHLHKCTYVSWLYCSTALAVLKKHYHALWRSFPDDHMITLTTLYEIFKISDDIIDMITSKPTFEEANQVMLNHMIFITNGDQQMNAFCDLMTRLINNPKLSRVTSNLKKGTGVYVCMYICMYVYMYVCVCVCMYVSVSDSIQILEFLASTLILHINAPKVRT